MNISEYQSRTDAELEGLAAGGDNEAFAALYDRHFDRVYDFSLRLLRDADEAADVTQNTFLKAMAALSPKKKTAAFTTWVLTIARNNALNRLRSRKAVAPPLEEAEEPEAVYREVDAGRLGSPVEALEARELAGLVWQAASALDPKQYSLLDLHLRQGLDSGEIAEVLGTSKNNAYVMMSRLKDSVEESITTFIMARRGRRECADLNELLTGRGTVFFDADMRKAVARHIEGCPTCQEQRKKLVSPTAIFGALAAVPVPLGLKQKALAEAMGQWATLVGSEAGKAGGFLSRLTQPIRSPLAALRQAGWFAGWKGAAFLVGALLIAGGIGGGGVVLSGALGGGGEERAFTQNQAQRTATATVGAVATVAPMPTATPTPAPSRAWSFEEALVLVDDGVASLPPTVDTSEGSDIDSITQGLRYKALSSYSIRGTGLNASWAGDSEPTVLLANLACENPANEKLAEAWLVAREVYRDFGSYLVDDGRETAETIDIYMESAFPAIQDCANSALTSEEAGQALLDRTSVVVPLSESPGDPPTYEELKSEVSDAFAIWGKDFTYSAFEACGRPSDVKDIQYYARHVLSQCATYVTNLADLHKITGISQFLTAIDSVKPFVYGQLQEFVAEGAFTREEAEAFWPLFAKAWFPE